MDIFKNLDLFDKIELAKEITKPFIRIYQKRKPILSSEWNLKIRTVQGKNKINLYDGEKIVDFITYESFIEDYSFNPNLKLENNKIIGNYFYTTVGLVNEETYYTAEDILENKVNYIDDEDLKLNTYYLSDKGDKLLYIGDIDLKLLIKENDTLYKEDFKSNKYFYNFNKERKLINIRKIKILDELYKNKDSVEIDLKDLKYSIEITSMKKNIIMYKNTTEENNFFSYVNIENTYFGTYVPAYYIDREEILKFMKSKSKFYELIRKPSLLMKNRDKLISETFTNQKKSCKIRIYEDREGKRYSEKEYV